MHRLPSSPGSMEGSSWCPIASPWGHEKTLPHTFHSASETLGPLEARLGTPWRDLGSFPREEGLTADRGCQARWEGGQSLSGTEKGWDLGPFAAVLQCLHLDTRLLEQQNTKKLCGTKKTCVGTSLGA